MRRKCCRETVPFANCHASIGGNKTWCGLTFGPEAYGTSSWTYTTCVPCIEAGKFKWGDYCESLAANATELLAIGKPGEHARLGVWP